MCNRGRVVFITAVPEATVEKHCESLTRKHEVRPPADGSNGSDVDTVSQAKCMDR